jgi:hypothetical protein
MTPKPWNQLHHPMKLLPHLDAQSMRLLALQLTKTWFFTRRVQAYSLEYEAKLDDFKKENNARRGRHHRHLQQGQGKAFSRIVSSRREKAR